MTWLIAGFGGLGQEMAQVMRHFPDLKQTPIVALRRHPPRDAATEEATETPTEKPTPNTQWFSADLTDPSTLNLPSGLSHVVYCATPDQRDEANYHLTYEVGLQNLVHALHQTGNHNARLLFAPIKRAGLMKRARPSPVALTAACCCVPNSGCWPIGQTLWC